MRRQNLSILIAALCFCLCAALAVCCVRSFEPARWESRDRLSVHHGPPDDGIYVELSSWHGELQFEYFLGPRFDRDNSSGIAGGESDRWSTESAGGYTGFSYYRDLIGPSLIVALPHWALFSLLLLFPSLAIRNLRKRYAARTRLARGLCLSCGYDLRASIGRCPECGRELKV
jgi:hypothetical protein